MQKMIAGDPASRPAWDTLELFARGQVQEFIQQLLEDEVTELLGRAKSARRAAVDAPIGSRHGHVKPRRLALMNGTISVRRPRVREVEEQFLSRLLPLFQRRSKEVTTLLPELYLHGLALGDFELALRGLLGDGAPLSASTILRLKATWQAQYAAWQQRDLRHVTLVYLWADGIYVKAGLDDSKAALLAGRALRHQPYFRR
jgi:transposase-like protein